MQISLAALRYYSAAAVELSTLRYCSFADHQDPDMYLMHEKNKTAVEEARKFGLDIFRVNYTIVSCYRIYTIHAGRVANSVGYPVRDQISFSSILSEQNAISMQTLGQQRKLSLANWKSSGND